MTHWQSGMALTPARLGAREAGTVSVTITGAVFALATITFAQAFATTPRLVCQVLSGASVAIGSTVLITALSTTSATIRVSLTASSTATVTVQWQAEQ